MGTDTNVNVYFLQTHKTHSYEGVHQSTNKNDPSSGTLGQDSWRATTNDQKQVSKK